MTLYSQILDLRADGHGTREIARQTGLTVFAVEGVVRKIRDIEAAGKQDAYSGDRQATIEHLQDIYHAHGFNKRWETYSIPPETPAPLRSIPLIGSLTGSPSAMCAGIA